MLNWDAAACLPWSCHLGLGSSPASQPGVGELALTLSGVELVLFSSAKAGLVWLTGPSFPFLLGPCKERVVCFFFSLASSASLFQLFFRVGFVRVWQCECAHSSADGEQRPALSQGDGNDLSGSAWREHFSSCCYLFLLSFSLN